MNKINQWYMANVDRKDRMQFAPRIELADGFTMSVQASEFHYCSPRVSGAEVYAAFEVGFPSAKEDLLMPYIDGSQDYDDPTRNVYGYVPAEVIDQIIQKHGGIKLDYHFT